LIPWHFLSPVAICIGQTWHSRQWCYSYCIVNGKTSWWCGALMRAVVGSWKLEVTCPLLGILPKLDDAGRRRPASSTMVFSV
jgi:hypothetical protein